MNKALLKFHDSGLRPSHQRLAVMTYLTEHRDHSTADEIYEGLSKIMPTLSKTTVYNTLHAFRRAGMITSFSIGGDAVRFDAFTEPHGHFYCDKCKKIIDVDLPKNIVDTLKHSAPKGTNEIQIFYNGLCDECNQNKSEEQTN
jgi:Fur family peroxide stress response transcriptional regulator